MPNYDRTGPTGKGPMTGRGLGKCKDAKTNIDGADKKGQGLGPCGQGLRRGLGRRFAQKWQDPAKEEE